MKKHELKEKTNNELAIELAKLKETYRELKFKKVTGVIENPLRLRIIRRNIARINTMLHLKEIQRIKNEIQTME